MRTVYIPTEHPYRVLIGEGLLDETGAALAGVHAPCRAAVVTDSTVAPLYLDRTLASLDGAGFETASFVFPAGEASKTAETWLSIQRFLAASELTRSDVLVALGGGVAGDMTGFAAATYQRGIPFIQVPTTLLSAVDASVGGKTAVDLPEGKNLVGAFHQPLAVVCDTATFATLPDARWQDGAAEMLKHGVLADPELFKLLSSGEWRDRAAELVERNVRIKRSFVVGDERDSGRRQLLNFGHTIGHAAESLSGFALSHGQAVALGMVTETRAARRLGLTEMSEEGIARACRRNDLPTECPFSPQEVLRAVLRDKKRAEDHVSVAVPRALGDVRLHQIRTEDLRDYIEKGICP